MTDIKKGWCDVPLTKMVKAVWNYKDDDEERESELHESLKRWGQVESIVIRPLGKKFEIVNGNHRLDPMTSLDMKIAHCYNTGKVSEAKARELAIVLNETRFPTDQLKLAKVIDTILKEQPIEELIKIVPWNMEEILALRSLVDVDWKKFGDGQVEIEPEGEWIRITFTVMDSQAKVINQAIDRICTALEIEGKNATGRALELIAADSINTPIESFK